MSAKIQNLHQARLVIQHLRIFAIHLTAVIALYIHLMNAIKIIQAVVAPAMDMIIVIRIMQVVPADMIGVV